jgi:hypothetical protein
MSTRNNLITGMAIGSGIMFLLDPAQGNRRRALVRDKAVHWSRTAGRALNRTGHTLEVGYRRTAAGGRGAVEAFRRLKGEAEPVPDDVLAARLRSCIGRHSSHPRAIEVAVRDGCATLSGPVLADEVREVLECASAVSGLMAVDNHLEVHVEPGSIPGLQGTRHRRGVRRWWERSPTLRMATGGAVAAAILVLAGRRVVSSS